MKQIPFTLMYHSVGVIGDDPHLLTVTPERLDAQLSALRAQGLRGMSMRDLLRSGARGVGLTFDDGYTDFVDIAVPILRRHGCTATVFNTTIALDNRPVSYATTFAYEDPACGTAPVTGSLRGVGHVTEHGLDRPSRIVGHLRLDAVAHQVPGIDCEGGVREFAYDATKA